MRSSGEKVISLAVVRINLGTSIKEYIAMTSESLKEISRSNAIAVILPALVTPLRDFIYGRRRYNSYRNHLNILLSKINALTRKYGKIVILTPVLRRAGNKIYITNIIIPPIGGPIHKGKTITSINNIISGGNDLELINIEDINLCFIILDDLEIPELFRACVLKGGDAAVVVQLPTLTYRDPSLTLSLSMVRARENRLPIIGVGGYLEDGAQQPSFVVGRDGSLIESTDSLQPDIFEVEIRKGERRMNTTLAKKYIKLVKELIQGSTYTPYYGME
ncbi:MAG: hypothetical protein B6U85_06320 [Desulfurococcales archaeon ex4484_42]|nr:MAG: hypothetical protein B6U85_06320 [Desulfurococcales archaeon ex4484_42]